MKRMFAFSLLVSSLVGTYVSGYTPEVQHAKLIAHHSLRFDEMQDDNLIPIVAIVSDLHRFVDLLDPRLRFVKLDNQPLFGYENRWRVTAHMTKKQLLSILDLPFIVSITLVESSEDLCIIPL